MKAIADTGFSSSYVLALIQQGMLTSVFNLSQNTARLADLAARYEDRRPDLADLCLIRMSELHPRHVLITVDENDFRVYRRNRREVIPLLCPTKPI